MLGLLRPAILIQLSQEDLHGYALLEGVEKFNFDFDRVDPSLIYRTLKKMVEDGLLESYQGAESLGPKRKIYHILPKGKENLSNLIISLNQRKNEIENLIISYNQIKDI